MPDDRDEFKKNYTGIYDPDRYYDYLQDCKKIETDLKDATYNPAYNTQLVRQAKETAFNRRLRG